MEKLKFDRLLDAIAKQSGVIIRAHLELGIPLEDLICASVKKAASNRLIDACQYELPLDGRSTR